MSGEVTRGAARHGGAFRGVILAGGAGSRLDPLTRAGVNKHLLPVGRKPMIWHAIDKMRAAGVRRVMIVTGTEHAGGLFQSLRAGAEFDCEFTYRVQEQAGGIAEALLLARDFIDGDPSCVILGDNVFEDPLGPLLDRFYEEVFVQGRGPRGRVVLKEVEDARRFGVAALDAEGHIARIVEKPVDPPSNLAVTGIYMYAGGRALFDLIGDLRPSGRGELEITDLHGLLLARGALTHDRLGGWWTDCGTHETLERASALLTTRGVA